MDAPTCPICLDGMFPAEEIHITDCNHVFHDECAQKWERVEMKQLCAYCRQQSIILLDWKKEDDRTNKVCFALLKIMQNKIYVKR